MLYLDSAMTIRGLSVFQDYNDKSRFYFMPGSPRIASQGGQPLFQLLTYRDRDDAGVGGGGFLTMTTDLGIAPSLFEQVEQELSTRFGVRATLTPVPVKSGTVRVTLLDSSVSGENGGRQTRLVENVIASSTPSLYAEQRAAFTVELSKKGAVLMEAALRAEGATPIVVLYDLQFVGLLPAYNLRIKISLQQSYQHLRTRAQANTLWFKTDVDQELEELRKRGAIEIEEVVAETKTAEDAATRMTRLNALAKELAQWTFFKPALNPGAVLASDRGTLQAYDSIADVSRITAGLTATSRAALTGVGATEDAGAPRRPGVAVATGAVESGATTASNPEPSSHEPSGQAPTAVEAWNRAGRPQGAFMLRQLSQDERQSVVYELRQVSAVERSIAPQGQLRLLAGASDLRGRILAVDADSDFFKTIAGTITTTADLAALGVAQISVKLRYGTRPDGGRWKDDFEAVLRAPGDSTPYRFFVDHLGTPELEYQVVLTNRPDSALGHAAASEESPWIPTTTRNLNINPLSFSSVMRVHVEAAMVDWTTVRQIQAHIAYQDPRSGVSAADTKILTQAAPSALVPIRPKDPRVREVTVTAKYFYGDGSSESVVRRQDGAEAFVLNQPPDSTTIVDVTLADLLQRYERVSVQLGRLGAGAPQVARTLSLQQANLVGRWSFRRSAPADGEYAYRTTSFMKDGSVRDGEWTTTDNPLLVVGDRALGILEVRVVLLGTMAENGLRLAKLELDYPGAPTWADSHTEQLLNDATTEFVWRVPMSKLGDASYTYRVTWFFRDNRRVTTPVKTSSDEILLLDPLAS